MRGLLTTALAALVLAGCAHDPPTTTPDPFDRVTPVDKVVYDRAARGSILGGVRHRKTDAPLGNALVLLRNERESVLEATTDDYGRYHFDGLPEGVYTVEVFVGQTSAAKIVPLSDSSRMVARFAVDPNDGPRTLLFVRDWNPEESLMSTDETEARLLGEPKTTYR